MPTPLAIASRGYAVSFAFHACQGRLLTLYFIEIGLTSTAIGALAAFPRVCSVFVAPLFAYTADRLKYVARGQTCFYVQCENGTRR